MEKHAAEDGDKATYIIICINGTEAAEGYQKKHGFKHVLNLTGEAPEEYDLNYIPHHCVIGEDGKVLMNYDQPTRDYMSVL